MPLNLSIAHGLERGGVDRTKAKWPDGNPVHHSVTTSIRRLVGRRDLLDRLDQGVKGNVVVEIAQKRVKARERGMNDDLVNEIGLLHAGVRARRVDGLDWSRKMNRSSRTLIRQPLS